MTVSQESNVERTIVARLMPGEDVLEEIEKLVLQYDILGGAINFIGAVRQATLGYFDLHAGKYKSFTFAEDLEVTSGMGNISRLEDGTQIVHAHVVVGNENGQSYSGHLMKGCIVSVTIEVVILVFDKPIVRSKDDRTGLNLLRLQ